jgi:hypothetical protein
LGTIKEYPVGYARSQFKTSMSTPVINRKEIIIQVKDKYFSNIHNSVLEIQKSLDLLYDMYPELRTRQNLGFMRVKVLQERKEKRNQESKDKAKDIKPFFLRERKALLK